MIESLRRIPREVRIHGGNDAFPSEIPYQVHSDYNGVFQCGGSIISTLAILTAAHCLTSKFSSGLKVVAGDYDREFDDETEQVRNVSHFNIHKDYNETTLENDIAVLFLTSPLEFNTHVQSIGLPWTPREFSGNATVSGWGNLNNTHDSWTLRKVNVPIIPSDVCRRLYRNISTITDKMLCAGTSGKDACKGDSGGPLTCVDHVSCNVLCGIVSFGRGCGYEKYPGVYVNVSQFTHWVSNALISGKLREEEVQQQIEELEKRMDFLTPVTILYSRQNDSEPLRYLIREGQCVELRILLDHEPGSIITRNMCVSVHRYKHSDCKGRDYQFFTGKFGRDQLYRNIRGSEGQFRSISIRKC